MDDRTAIANLVNGYAERLDGGDFAGVAEMFRHARITAEGATGGFEGYDGVLRQYERSTRRYEDGTPRTKHVTTNLILELEEDEAAAVPTASARSYYTVLQAVPGSLALQPIIAGRYHDILEKVDGRWRFRSRHIFVDLVGDLSQHLLFDLERK